MGIDKETGEDRQARLFELTSQTSLPTMFHDDERPRNVWIEQLALAERVGSPSAPALIPFDVAQRVEMLVCVRSSWGRWHGLEYEEIMNDGPLSRKYGYNEIMSAAWRQPRWPRWIALIDARLKNSGRELFCVSCWRCCFGRGYLLGDHEHVCHCNATGRHHARDNDRTKAC